VGKREEAKKRRKEKLRMEKVKGGNKKRNAKEY
jgi:hypothetical protein